MMHGEPSERRPAALLAWLVHLFTASGAVLALLALAAIEAREWRLAFALAAARRSPSTASTARWRGGRGSSERLPRIDGAMLDLVIDYLNYVFVPTLFIWRAGLLPRAARASPLAAAIQISALYVFARADMKTEDDYFRGFPALWNVVALYLFAAGPARTASAAIVALLVALSFAPVHFVHPFRVRDYGIWLPLLAMLWAAVERGAAVAGLDAPARAALLWSRCLGLLLVALGLLRSCSACCAALPPRAAASRPKRENGGRGKD